MPTRQLPVFAALAHVFRSAVGNCRFAFHASWPWLLVLAPPNIIYDFYRLAQLPDLGKPTPDTVLLPGPFEVMMVLFSMFAFSSIAVNWHRYILLDQVPIGWARLRMDNTVWKYFGSTLLIMFGVGLTMVPILVLGGALAWLLGPVGSAIFPILGLAGLAATVVTFYRWSIKLPAIALGRADYKIANAMADTQGNFWQILGLAVLISIAVLAFLLVLLLMSAATIVSGNGLVIVLGLAVQVMANWFVTILSVTLLTSLYGYFAEKRDF
jgi:hypothetical protein